MRPHYLLTALAVPGFEQCCRCSNRSAGVRLRQGRGCLCPVPHPHFRAAPALFSGCLPQLELTAIRPHCPLYPSRALRSILPALSALAKCALRLSLQLLQPL